MKNTKLYLPVIIAVSIIIGIFLGTKLSPLSNGKGKFFTFKFGQYDKINDILNFISRDYVDEINKDTLVDNSIGAILQQLDPHTSYLSSTEFKRMHELLEGSFEGIGIQFRIIKDSLTVILPVKKGPSEKAGINAGDRIIAVDEENIAGIGLTEDEVIKKLKGPRGTKVKIKVFRRNELSLLNFEIVRDVIPTYSLDIAYMVNKEIAYIKVSSFTATTADEFHQALIKMKESGMKKLILDLRGNGGGYLEAAKKIADEFLNEDLTIVYTMGRNRPKNTATSTSKGLLKNEPLVVLIDELSASASEIVSGAIQDNDRGIIIGRRSFGKGLVQEEVKLPDGSAIRLTTARYYTPSGRCIQRPYTKNSVDYYHNIINRMSNGGEDSIPEISQDTTTYKTVGGRIVYGGGGIMPDIIVPQSGVESSEFLKQISDAGLIDHFSMDFTDLHRSELAKYKDPENFIRNFKITQSIKDELDIYVKKAGIEFNQLGFKKSEKIIKIRIKALIGRNLFGEEAFYPIIHEIDNTLKKAIEELE